MGRVKRLLLAVCLFLVLGEAGARLFWYARFGVPLFQPDQVLRAFYPGLAAIDDEQPRHEDDMFDILLLGGSVLHRDWGTVEQSLRERLALQGAHRVRIFNLAAPGQSSQDSLNKYEAVRNARFDLVVVYHGINDARTNNVPPEDFRDHYAHYAWYDRVNMLATYQGAARFAVPYTLRYAALLLKPEAGYLPTDEPRPEWAQYGGHLKSVEVFRENIESIAGLANERHDPLMLITFATYVPPGYSREAFARHELDYAEYAEPIETWGEPRHVADAIARQNEVVRRIAAETGALLIDAASTMPRGARYFNDVCHFTVEGSTQFVAGLLAPVMGVVESWKADGHSAGVGGH